MVSAIFNKLEREVDAPEYILMETINALPDNVHKAYENILEKSPKKHILKKVLHVMLAAFRPLSVTEMNVVLSTQDTSQGPRYSGLHSENSFRKWLEISVASSSILLTTSFKLPIKQHESFLLEKTAIKPLWDHGKARFSWLIRIQSLLGSV